MKAQVLDKKERNVKSRMGVTKKEWRGAGCVWAVRGGGGRGGGGSLGYHRFLQGGVSQSLEKIEREGLREMKKLLASDQGKREALS